MGGAQSTHTRAQSASYLAVRAAGACLRRAGRRICVAVVVCHDARPPSHMSRGFTLAEARPDRAIHMRKA